MGAILKLFLTTVLGAIVDGAVKWLERRREEARHAKAEADRKALEEERRTNAALKAQSDVDAGIIADPTSVRRDPDQRDPEADKAG